MFALFQYVEDLQVVVVPRAVVERGWSEGVKDAAEQDLSSDTKFKAQALIFPELGAFPQEQQKIDFSSSSFVAIDWCSIQPLHI